uniref:RRM domain-containing protein n=1 Tax=Ciona intestinalis TaxID=7719 RepID=F6R2J6_CIOIN
MVGDGGQIQQIQNIASTTYGMTTTTTTSTNQAQTNLIVNYLPQTLSDQEFYQLFNNVGAVTSARIIRDKQSGYSFGYGFVDYVKPEDADKAIQQLNGHPIQHKTIKVAFSKPAGADSKNINLYVAGLNPDTSEESLKQRFSSYGTIIQTRVLKDKNTNLCSGIGFVLFNTKDEAMAAIKALNGAVFSQASTSPLVVKFAKTDHQIAGFICLLLATVYPVACVLAMRKLHSGLYLYFQFHIIVVTTTAALVLGVGTTLGEAEGRIVYVYGIGPYTDENALWHLFFNFGTIVRVNVIYDQSTWCKLFAFSTMLNFEILQLVVAEMNRLGIRVKSVSLKLGKQHNS